MVDEHSPNIILRESPVYMQSYITLVDTSLAQLANSSLSFKQINLDGGPNDNNRSVLGLCQIWM